jgi:hypothetical protein
MGCVRWLCGRGAVCARRDDCGCASATSVKVRPIEVLFGPATCYLYVIMMARIRNQYDGEIV